MTAIDPAEPLRNFGVFINGNCILMHTEERCLTVVTLLQKQGFDASVFPLALFT